MFSPRDRDPLSWPDFWQAAGGLGIIAGIVLAVVMFTAAVRDRPNLDAQQIIQAGKMMVGELGR